MGLCSPSLAAAYFPAPYAVFGPRLFFIREAPVVTEESAYFAYFSR